MLTSTTPVGSVISQSICHHGDLLAGLSMMALNTCVLVQKVSSSCFSKELGRVSQFVLSLADGVTIPLKIIIAKKSWKDLTRARCVNELEGIVFSSLKVANGTLDLFLKIGSVSMAIIRFSGNKQFVATYFRHTTPIALISFSVTLFLDFYRLVTKGALSEKVIQLSRSDSSRIENLFIQLKEENTIFSSELIRNIDAFVWSDLKETLEFECALLRKREIIKGIGEYLRKVHQNGVASIGVHLFTQVVVMVGRVYPESLVQVVSSWSLGVLQTSKLIHRKITERQTQQVISARDRKLKKRVFQLK